MGVESGEDLERILRRKDMERLSNDGIFVWGVGNPLGQGLRDLIRRSGEPKVVFSPMRSAAAAIDASPSGVTLWLDYFDHDGGVRPLPAGSLVTSRSETPAGALKRTHYALFCRSDVPLSGCASDGKINFGELRNLSTGKALGFSQVTAIVSKALDRCSLKNTQYDALMCCYLVDPYFVKLCNGVVLSKEQLLLLEAASVETSSDAWLQQVTSLKTSARASFYRSNALHLHHNHIARLPLL